MLTSESGVMHWITWLRHSARLSLAVMSWWEQSLWERGKKCASGHALSCKNVDFSFLHVFFLPLLFFTLPVFEEDNFLILAACPDSLVLSPSFYIPPLPWYPFLACLLPFHSLSLAVSKSSFLFFRSFPSYPFRGVWRILLCEQFLSLSLGYIPILLSSLWETDICPIC